MIHTIKKRSLFLIGLFVAGVTGIVSDYFGDHFTKDGSLILPSAHADYTPYPVGDTGGDGCGGCSGDSSF